jgi:hypothetical protein
MRAILETSRLRIRPGVPTTLDIDVVNTADVIDGVTADVFGLDPAWVRMTPPVVTLFPEGAGRLSIVFDVPTACPSGDSMLLIRVVSTIDATRFDEHDVWITVDPVEAAQLRLRPSLVVGGADAEFSIEVTNTGNIGTDLSITALDPTRAVECRTSPSLLVVEPQDTGSAVVHVHGRRPWFGQSTSRTVQITASSPALTLTETARFTQKPRIPRGVVTALILIAIIALWAFIFLFVVQLLRGSAAPAKSVPTNWNQGGTREVNLADVVGTVSGSVTASTTGDGLARITVEAYRLRTGTASDKPELTASAATGDDGSYSLAALLPGKYRLRFSADGFTPLWYPAAADPTAAKIMSIEPLQKLTGIDVVLAGHLGQFSGKVDLPEGADPTVPAMMTYTLVPENPTDKVPAPVTMPVSGAFVVPNLPTPAKYQVTIARPGFDAQTFDVSLTGGQATVIDTNQLAASDGSIAGTVSTASGTPLGEVIVTSRNGPLQRIMTTPTTGDVGAFSLDNLPTPGTYVLTFSRDGYAATTVALSLDGGQHLGGLAVQLKGGSGSVLGTVIDPAFNALGGVGVLVAGGEVHASTTTLTAGDNTSGVGSFRIDDLPAPGVYTVTFTLAGFGIETTTVSFLGPGEQSVVNIKLKPVTGSVNGTVTIGGGGRSGLTVALSDGTTTRTTQTATQPAGAYQFARVAPGTYTLRVSGAGISDSVVIVVVHAGEDVSHNVSAG